jgi:hypothetical protein
MTGPAPAQEWWSAAELAASGLPDVPGTKRRVNDLAQREGWAMMAGKVRRRRGAGGGIEYHWSLLPLRARLQLGSGPAKVPRERRGPDEAWARYEAAGDKAREEAGARLAAIAEVEALEAAGLTRSMAVRDVAGTLGRTEKSLWNWLGMIDGVRAADRLACLIDGRAVRRSGGARVELDDAFIALVRSDWLRLSQPSLTSCYDRAARVWLAEKRNSPVPPLHQVRRRIRAEVSRPTEVFLRKGAEALKRFYPAQVRSKAFMAPMECIQGDYHKFDVFVQWPGVEKPVRPQLMVWSDVYSGKLLAWRLSDTANSHTVQLVTGDLIRKWGVPQAALMDNGREFAAKAMTGGAPSRFRFKIRDEDIPGLLPLLGIEIHWATPYAGQSKPIERAFRDLCDRVARHPAFDGAYTGNNPTAKPEDYGSRAIPLEDFKAVMEEEMAHHNERRAAAPVPDAGRGCAREKGQWRADALRLALLVGVDVSDRGRAGGCAVRCRRSGRRAGGLRPQGPLPWPCRVPRGGPVPECRSCARPQPQARRVGQGAEGRGRGGARAERGGDRGAAARGGRACPRRALARGAGASAGGAAQGRAEAAGGAGGG